jgi:very-short-patch-repair endonuclease
MPEWIEEYQRTGDMRQDPYFMNWEFTPIENSVWADIRGMGLPFFPQVPALNYFLDFACPFLKIAIECDGKAWHDHDLDKARDARLAANGWMIFRIEGHECYRVITPWDENEEEENHEAVEQYFLTTSEGIVSAIQRRYFNDSSTEKYNHWIESTLFNHRSTPETFPNRVIPQKPSGPVLFSAALVPWLETFMQRLERSA